MPTHGRGTSEQACSAANKSFTPPLGGQIEYA
jgi:hypothetical protein